MIRRQPAFFAALFAGIAAAAACTALSAGPAQALTIENYQGAGSGPANGWVDLNYSDPNRKAPKDGDKNNLQGGPGSTNFKFGPSEPAFNNRFNSNSYFSPNYLMGK